MDGKYYRKRKYCYLKQSLASHSGFTRCKARLVCCGARFVNAEKQLSLVVTASGDTSTGGRGMGERVGHPALTPLLHPKCLFNHSKRLFPFSAAASCCPGLNVWQMMAAASPCLPPA